MENRESNSFIALCLAYAYFDAGNPDKGFEHLEGAKEHAFYAWIRVLVKDEKIKQDPRYLKLIEEIVFAKPGPVDL